MRTREEVKPQPQTPHSVASAWHHAKSANLPGTAKLRSPSSLTALPLAIGSVPLLQSKNYSKGELDVFLLLIKRGKATQRWQFSSSQPLPVPCTSNTRFPAGVAPASPLLPASGFQQPMAEHAGRSEPGGGKTAHSASREEKGKEYPERNALQHCRLSVGKKKYPGSFHRWFGHRSGRHEADPRHGERWDGHRDVLPRKVLWAPLLLPVKLQTISQPHSWQGLGPNPGARVARHCHTGEAAPRRYRHRPGGRKPRADPASGAPGSRDAAFHHETSVHAQHQPIPATQRHRHTVPALLEIIWLILLLSFFFFFPPP